VLSTKKSMKSISHISFGASTKKREVSRNNFHGLMPRCRLPLVVNAMLNLPIIITE